MEPNSSLKLKGVNDVKAYCIYEGDEFETEYDIETAVIRITKFNPKFENINNTKIIGAFAVILGDKGPIYTEIMNINQIKKAWNQETSKSITYTDFEEEMAKKTVINRACKMFVSTSYDNYILLEAFNNSDREVEQEDNIESEIKDKANSKIIDLPEENENIKEGPDF